MDLQRSPSRRDEASSTDAAGITVEQVDEHARLAGLIPQKVSRYKCSCGSADGVLVRPSYRYPKYVEYALCRVCLSRTVCCITIGAVDAARAPNLPSHLFPGCGSDGAEFAVTHGRKPTRIEISDMLGQAIVDCVVVEYNEDSGEGYFRVVDGDAPPTGAVIPLIGWPRV